MIEPINFSQLEIVPKGWGRELLIVNKDYCGKILEFNAGAKFSFHYHDQKSESFLLLKGKMLFYYYDLAKAEEKQTEINPGLVIHIPRGNPHKLVAIEPSVIVEFSTHHEDSDSYRIGKGDSQNVS